MRAKFFFFFLFFLNSPPNSCTDRFSNAFPYPASDHKPYICCRYSDTFAFSISYSCPNILSDDCISDWSAFTSTN